ncbi:hypothetical protein CFE70_007028 [Pyrenophora teres f. teres 0-1]|uniref:Uncharacterized protein n=1 Tax=Pyrenophora teres f. teres TaxID=97479 RepID=A0A6S6W6V7_9PLEO|nr:hypothetical protein HRS9139_10309 [Pyrenophora teres f. teres]KAE8835076.1 hypothetical protein PTNB85_06409 [Pyrenophora teres f. teres]KAE8843450.1 hypothetical protein HRS9122_04553 [Pyrenophora teres f. teres]KAE8856764.1 hypothetical protein PTNB73_09486 [Pyrenophora teres f. teres]KAE8861365.1 hypothetical protein PTNB29_06460 [Pyrenophora teres f. teres]
MGTYHLFITDTNFPRTIENQSRSPPLRLPPAELRNKIYETTFSGGMVRVRKTSIQTENVHAQQTAGALSLRATCRQIRYESESVFYQQYIFNFCKFVEFEPAAIAKVLMIDNYQRIEKIAVNLRVGFFIWLHLDDNNPNERHGLFPRLQHFYTHDFVDPGPSPSAHTAMARAFGRPDLELHKAKYLVEEEDYEDDEGDEDDKDDD